MRKNSVAFANFVCTFGDRGGLLDNSEIVLPAFLTDTMVRTYGDSDYHLYDVKLSKLDGTDVEPVLGISGHFVKNVVLAREQVFDATGGIVKSPNTMKSSPSAFFVLVLNTHRLMYLAETNFAPDLKSFEATMANFIKKVREDKINHDFKNEANKATKKSMQEALPRPIVKIVPLSEAERISDYISRFSTIKSLRLRLIRPNHETDASEVVNAVRTRFGSLEPDRLDIIASRSDGMDKVAVAQAVEEATVTGNTSIDLRGEDGQGGRLRGSNDEFALTVEVDKLAKNDDGLRVQLFELYKTMLASGKIKLGAGLNAASDKISHLATLL